ncbi:unnamed protein product, partial [Didymodactylos carnosus]
MIINDVTLFNRGALFNIGYSEAVKFYNFTCFIFHDVDLLPEDNRISYKCHDRPMHFAVSTDKYNYKLPYADYFGGVTAFNTNDFLTINGFSNVYAGWGGEDDDLRRRVNQKFGSAILRPPPEIGHYKMIRQFGHVSAPLGIYRFSLLKS